MSNVSHFYSNIHKKKDTEKQANYSAKSRKKNDSSSLIKPRSKQKKKRQLSPRKSQWYQTNKQTNKPASQIPPLSITPLNYTHTHIHPSSTSSPLTRKRSKDKGRPQSSRKRIPEDNRRTPIIRPLLRGICVQARPFDNVRSAWSIGPKKLCKHQSALASEPARVTLIAEFGHGSRDGARSNQAEGCQSTVASGYQKSVNFRAGDTRGVVKGMIKI
jgi:hypothetical protein